MIDKWINRNCIVLIKVTCFSLLFCFLVIVSIGYIVYEKTDLYRKVLTKVGLMDYNVDNTRRQVEWRVLEGWANSIEKMNLNADVVFYGNSIIYESNFQLFFSDLRVCNLGCNRDDLDDLIFRSFMIKSAKPQKIFVLGGINRLMDTSLEDFEKKYSLLIDTIIKQNPSAEIFLQSMLPVNVEMEIGSRYKDCVNKIKQANIIIKRISMSRQCVFVDLYTAYNVNDLLPTKLTRDGVHLTPDAYAIWAQLIKPYLLR